jgi:ubiquinone/menaquinone biosynthesis C-methylase UbiE
MSMGIGALREVVSRLHLSANALAAVGAALDARASGVPLEPRVQRCVDDVLAALDIGPLDDISPVELGSALAEIRVYTLTNAKLLFASSRGSRWNHAEPAILDAAGEVSRLFPHALKKAILPSLEGLAERLDRPGASFLDVGVGVAAMSVEMIRLFPSLRVVGLDTWAPALAAARERVRAEKLEDRIELRQQPGEELRDVEAFDLAWTPSVFLPEESISAILRNTRRALRAGGWLLFPMLRPIGDRLGASLVRLRMAMFGGLETTTENAERLLRDHGFVQVRTLPGPPNAIAAMVVGRREG